MTETLLSIDPGPRESAYMRMFDRKPVQFDLVPNEVLLELMASNEITMAVADVVIETIFPRGQAVGLETMDTQFWAGRFAQVAHYQGRPFHKIDRQDVRFAICGSLDTRDANVRQGLIDYYGGSGGKAAAIGTKKQPGVLYGIKEDIWSALAIGLAFSLRREHRKAS